MKFYNRFPAIEVAVFAASCIFFWSVLYYDVASDIKIHNMVIHKVVEGGYSPPPNFLYYLAVYVVALGQTEQVYLQTASIVVLSLSIVAKYIVTKRCSIELYSHLFGDKKVPYSLIVVISLCLLVVFSLPANSVFAGQITPTIWHNSTTIFLMPFALLLFWSSYKQTIVSSANRNLQIAILCFLNILIKPSYFLVFVVAYPLISFRSYGIGARLARNMMPVMLGIIGLFLLYYLIYIVQGGGVESDGTGVALMPFHVWSHYSPNIVLSLVASLAFPISYSVFYFGDILKHTILQYAIASYLIAISITAMFAETGERLLHGNFFWQSIVCSYLLFFVFSVFYVHKVRRFGFGNRANFFITVAFISHVLSGVWFLARYLYLKTYL